MHYESGHGEGCCCEVCEPRCCLCLARISLEEAEKHPIQPLCVGCVSDIADLMTPRTRESIEAELAALKLFGFGFEHAPVRELTWALEAA